MADARDILGVGAPAPAPAKAEKPKQVARKPPKGMSREAFALLEGANPIMTTQIMEGLKKEKKDKQRPAGRGTVVWRQRPFANQARADALQLVHWAKGFKDSNGRVRDAHEGDYPFAKFNKKVGGCCGCAHIFFAHCAHAVPCCVVWRARGDPPSAKVVLQQCSNRKAGRATVCCNCVVSATFESKPVGLSDNSTYTRLTQSTPQNTQHTQCSAPSTATMRRSGRR